jgi:pimeloyl-ACP methyl ester carboxylesterase
LIKLALARIGVSHAVVLGHSWGASVAIALALRYPALVRGLVLASGYYYPTLRWMRLYQPRRPCHWSETS